MSEQDDMDVNAAFRRLRALDRSLLERKVNKDERASTLISASIREGFTAGKRITGVLETLGMHKQHAGIRLKAGLQCEPKWPNWSRRDDGTYYVPDEVLPVI